MKWHRKVQHSLVTLRLAAGLAQVFLSCLIAFAIGFPKTASGSNQDRPLKSIRIFPSQVFLGSQRASQKLIVQGYYADGYSKDISSSAQFSSANPKVIRIEGSEARPVGSGVTTIAAVVDGISAEAPAVVKDIDQKAEWSFRNHVIPVLTKSGCNMGACHGAAAGKGGFKLTLRGYDPDADYLVMTRESVGRRICREEPGRSLILLKPTLFIPHGGGRRFGTDSLEYQVIAQWIAEGTKPPNPRERRIDHISIEPSSSKLSPKTHQQLLVTAHFNDGYVEDVTRWARFESTNSGTATVDEKGQVELKGSGEAAVTAMYLSKVAVSTLVVPFANQIDPAVFSKAEQNNYIDQLVSEKLQTLNIAPSPLCTDSEFIRRAYLDTTGSLPPPDVAREFLANTKPGKRQELIEGLLKSQAYVDYWAYKWSDLLLLSDNKATSGNKKLNPSAVRSFYEWIRSSVEQNKPWNQMVRELLVSTGSSRDNGALNFYQIHKDPITLTENTTVAFMGLRLTCARCHNHPLEKWTQVDYFKMANLFSRVKQKVGDSPGEIIVFNTIEGNIEHPRLNKPLPPTPLDGQALALDSTEDRRQHLAEWLTSPHNTSFSRTVVNRVWANFMGRGLADPVDDIRSTNPPSNEPLMAELVNDFVDHGYDMKHLCKVILTSATYQRSWRTTPSSVNDDRYFSHYLAKRLSAEVILDAVSQVTGVPTDFPGYPVGTRALQLPDTSIDSYFLDVFGRPQRAATCDCERDSQPNLRQTLHVINGETINKKLSAQGGFVDVAIQQNLDNDQVLKALYLSAYSRYPTPSEISQAEALLGAGHQPGSQGERRQVLEDFAWAMLTDKEFVFNH